MKAYAKFLLALFLIIGLCLSATQALAHNNNLNQSEKAQEARTKVAEKKAAVQARLADKKLDICRKREAKINSILTRIATRGEKQMEVFNKIAERTIAYKTDKALTVENYDALVADVEAKKLAATETLTEIKETSVTFDCDGNDPKGVASSFKQQLKDQIAALKAYKTSIKNLIVAVKSSQTDTEAEEGASE